MLSTLLKKSHASSPEYTKVVELFPMILKLVNQSDDMFMLLHGTAAIKDFICYGHEAVLKISTPDQIVDTAKKLLLPQTNEQAALCLGNLVI